MNHEDFLNDMFCYYSMNPHMRAVNENGNCRYRLEDPFQPIRRCAIGRHIPDDLYRIDIEGDNASNVMKMLEIDIQHLDPRFLNKVQEFHDCGSWWNYGGGWSYPTLFNHGEGVRWLGRPLCSRP